MPFSMRSMRERNLVDRSEAALQTVSTFFTASSDAWYSRAQASAFLTCCSAEAASEDSCSTTTSVHAVCSGK